ncbi:hypothetical protein ACVW1B_003781 [Bradyrhizobium sp. USDA 4502]
MEGGCSCWRTGGHFREAALCSADTVVRAMPHDMLRYWQPTAEGYLERSSKDGILKAVREGVSPEAAAHLAGKGWLPSLVKSAP